LPNNAAMEQFNPEITISPGAPPPVYQPITPGNGNNAKVKKVKTTKTSSSKKAKGVDLERLDIEKYKKMC
jgi:hypothetical protein